MAAIRSNAPLKCDCTLGWYGVAASEMGVQAFRRQQYTRWDEGRQRIVKG
jgi:hypothetical protein